MPAQPTVRSGTCATTLVVVMLAAGCGGGNADRLAGVRQGDSFERVRRAAGRSPWHEFTTQAPEGKLLCVGYSVNAPGNDGRSFFFLFRDGRLLRIVQPPLDCTGYGSSSTTRGFHFNTHEQTWERVDRVLNAPAVPGDQLRRIARSVGPDPKQDLYDTTLVMMLPLMPIILPPAIIGYEIEKAQAARYDATALRLGAAVREVERRLGRPWEQRTGQDGATEARLYGPPAEKEGSPVLVEYSDGRASALFSDSFASGGNFFYDRQGVRFRRSQPTAATQASETQPAPATQPAYDD